MWVEGAVTENHYHLRFTWGHGYTTSLYWCPELHGALGGTSVLLVFTGALKCTYLFLWPAIRCASVRPLVSPTCMSASYAACREVMEVDACHLLSGHPLRVCPARRMSHATSPPVGGASAGYEGGGYSASPSISATSSCSMRSASSSMSSPSPQNWTRTSTQNVSMSR